jgi:WD40 repeat protein
MNELIVKIVSSTARGFRYVKNLRAEAKAAGSINAVTDIAWHPMESHKEWICTAPSNGQVVLWNLNREGVRQRGHSITHSIDSLLSLSLSCVVAANWFSVMIIEAVFPGHERLVNRVCWHPLEAPILFSGSQDGTVRMWVCYVIHQFVVIVSPSFVTIC